MTRTAFQPKVSVVLVCYNNKEFVADAIESVLGQTYADVELITIANGSTDGSREIMESYAKKDRRVRVIVHGENGAITKRCNEGIAAAAGEYIAILYADDTYLPHFLERSMACFAGLGPEYGVVYSAGYRHNVFTGERLLDKSIKASGHILRECFEKYHTEGHINPVSPVIRKSCFVKYPFHEDVFSEGEDIFLRMAISYQFRYIDEPLVVMRDHASNLGKAIKRNRDAFMGLMRKYVAEPAFPAELTRVRDRFVARVLRNYGWQGVRVAGDHAWARECFAKAIEWDWTSALHPRTFAGIALSALPPRYLSLLNSLGNRTHSDGRVIAFRE